MICILDSGIGGLETLSLIEGKTSLPIFYYADKNNFPYGEKTEEQIAKALEKAYKLFEEKKAEYILLACNTASTISHKYFGEKYKNIKIIGTLEALKSFPEEAIIISTKLTATQLKKLWPEREIQAQPGLEDLIETNQIKEIRSYISQNTPKAKKIILGCTHYPLAIEIFKKELPETEFFNPASKIAQFILEKTSGSNKILNFSHEEIEKKYKELKNQDMRVKWE